jgi:hypothetical protein
MADGYAMLGSLAATGAFLEAFVPVRSDEIGANL